VQQVPEIHDSSAADADSEAEVTATGMLQALLQAFRV